MYRSDDRVAVADVNDAGLTPTESIYVDKQASFEDRTSPPDTTEIDLDAETER